MSKKHEGYTPGPRPCVLCHKPIPQERSEKYFCSTKCDAAVIAKTGLPHLPTMRTGWAARTLEERSRGPR